MDTKPVIFIVKNIMSVIQTTIETEVINTTKEIEKAWDIVFEAGLRDIFQAIKENYNKEFEERRINLRIKKIEILRIDKKSKKKKFRDYKLSYLNYEDAEKIAKENGFEFFGDETCLLLYGYKTAWAEFEPVFCLKGDHWDNLMEIKREVRKQVGFGFDFDDLSLEKFLEYYKKNKHLEIK